MLHHEYVELAELEAVVRRVDEVGMLRQPELHLHQVHHVRYQVIHAHQRAPPVAEDAAGDGGRTLANHRLTRHHSRVSLSKARLKHVRVDLLGSASLGSSLVWLTLRASAEQFQLTGRGSCSGHEASHAPAYHGAGSKGSCAALGAMYAKKGLLGLGIGLGLRQSSCGNGMLNRKDHNALGTHRCGSVATVWRIQAMETLPITLVL